MKPNSLILWSLVGAGVVLGVAIVLRQPDNLFVRATRKLADLFEGATEVAPVDVQKATLTTTTLTPAEKPLEQMLDVLTHRADIPETPIKQAFEEALHAH